MQTPNAPMRFTKHHGAGNDFLVLVDVDRTSAYGPELVRSLCDRRRGIGADGLIRVSAGRGGADLRMELANADGSEAEMSGNGIRCLAQAAVDAGLVRPPSFTVDTGAGRVTIRGYVATGAGAASAGAELGVVKVGPEEPEPIEGRRAATADLGNPHLVLLGGDPADVDVVVVGARLQRHRPGGINVEFVAVGSREDSLDLRVFERGVGETLACGTGSVAAAAVARSWGLVGDVVDVHNPGGDLRVTFDGDTAVLFGPVRKVADVIVDPRALEDLR